MDRDSQPTEHISERRRKSVLSGRAAACLLRLLSLARAREMPLLPAVAAGTGLAGLRRAQPFLHQADLREDNLVDRLCEALSRGVDAEAAGMLRTLQGVGLPAEGLRQLADWLSARAEYRHDLFRAVSYPFTLVVTVALAFVPLFNGLLLPFVLGRFRDLFEDLGATESLPGLTRWWLDFYDALGTDWTRPLVAVLYVAATLGLCWLLWRFGTRLPSSRIGLRLPLAGSYVRYAAALGFCEYLALQLRYEVPLHEAVRRAAGTIANRSLRERLQALGDRLEGGVSLATVLAGTTLLPRTIAFRLCAADRRSGLQDELPSIAAECRCNMRLLELRLTGSARALAAVVAVTVLSPVIVSVVAVYLPLFTLFTSLG